MRYGNVFSRGCNPEKLRRTQSEPLVSTTEADLVTKSTLPVRNKDGTAGMLADRHDEPRNFSGRFPAPEV
jgi:hypothetical protein